MIDRLIDCLRAMRAYWLWLGEMARNDDALYDQSTRDLKLHIAQARDLPVRGLLEVIGGVDAMFDAPEARECQLPHCQTCEPEPPLVIQSEALFLGREPIEGENIRQVAVWLRLRHPEMWGDADEGELQQVAYWLLDLRDRCEDGRVSVS